MLVHHAAPDRRQQSHRSAVAAVGLFPDHVKRAQIIVFVALTPLAVNADRPSEAGLELVCPVTKHRLREERKLLKLVCVKVADHVVSPVVR